MPAVAVPLFNPDVATVLAALRLSDIDQSDDAAAIVDEATTRSRLYFYQTLGTSRVDTILQEDYTAPPDVPDTPEKRLRMVGASTEILLVKVYLLDSLPVQFSETGEANAIDMLNFEALFRGFSKSELEHLRKSLWSSIRESIIFLEGEIPEGTLDTGMKVEVIEPECKYPPGSNIFNA